MVRFEILEQGAGYTTKQHEFLRSTNVTFRPIDIKLGPDGALYIADWSNPIIQHGEVDFRDPRRDREHGRIWRVGYKKAQEKKPDWYAYVPKAATAGGTIDMNRLVSADLLKELPSSNGWNEKQARRVLIERAHTTE